MIYIISSIAYLALVLSLSVFVFDPTHLYYELPWLDIPMHALGGFGVVCLVFSIARYFKKSASFKVVLFSYLVVAIGWELYELAHDIIRQTEWNDITDTVADVINGALGGVVAYFFFKK
jgi:hypothetical protein